MGPYHTFQSFKVSTFPSSEVPTLRKHQMSKFKLRNFGFIRQHMPTQKKNERQLTILVFNPYSAGIDFRRQDMTSVDVRF